MTAPREVLDQHTTLYERLKYPSAVVTGFYATFFTKEALLSMERDVGANGPMLSQWLQMLAPAGNEREFRHLEDYSAVAAPHHAVPLDGDRAHCAVCRTRITRVRAYVKGPGGLPLKAVPETVYRVAR